MNKCIGTRFSQISQDSLFIVAEVGNQFNGSVEVSKKLIDVCVDAGADAIKFIFWFPDEIFTDKSVMYKYETSEGFKVEPLWDIVERLTLPLSDWWKVRTYALKKELTMMATVLSPTGFEWAENLGLEAIKLSTWDWNYHELWRWAARSGRPVIADCGAVSEEEIEENVNIFKEEKNDNLALLHCFHTYKHDQMNMSTIPYLRERFDCLVGYAPADINDDLDIMSVGMGACILEKRLTLDCEGGVLHDIVSKEPAEFKKYVDKMRLLKQAVGEYGVFPSDGDLEQRKKWFRRLVADRNILKNNIIDSSMIASKRGEYGISPKYIYDFLGKKSRRDVDRNSDITYNCI